MSDSLAVWIVAHQFTQHAHARRGSPGVEGLAVAKSEVEGWHYQGAVHAQRLLQRVDYSAGATNHRTKAFIRTVNKHYIAVLDPELAERACQLLRGKTCRANMCFPLFHQRPSIAPIRRLAVRDQVRLRRAMRSGDLRRARRSRRSFSLAPRRSAHSLASSPSTATVRSAAIPSR